MFCGGGGGTVVGGGSGCGDVGGVKTGGGFQRSYDYLTAWIGSLCPPPPHILVAELAHRFNDV